MLQDHFQIGAVGSDDAAAVREFQESGAYHVMVIQLRRDFEQIEGGEQVVPVHRHEPLPLHAPEGVHIVDADSRVLFPEELVCLGEKILVFLNPSADHEAAVVPGSIVRDNQLELLPLAEFLYLIFDAFQHVGNDIRLIVACDYKCEHFSASGLGTISVVCKQFFPVVRLIFMRKYTIL